MKIWKLETAKLCEMFTDKKKATAVLFSCQLYLDKHIFIKLTEIDNKKESILTEIKISDDTDTNYSKNREGKISL